MIDRAIESKWEAPYFAHPKPKTNRFSFPRDFKYLNNQQKPKLYPTHNINEILFKLEGFQYALSLGLNMGYYHIRLTEDTSNLCTIIIPWGKYHYKHITMLVSKSPEILQQKMNN